MFSKDIPDTKELKIAILRKETPDTEFLEKYGERPRVYRNTVMFLCAAESHRDSFHIFLRRLLALKSIEEDKSLKITEGQKKEIKNYTAGGFASLDRTRYGAIVFFEVRGGKINFSSPNPDFFFPQARLRSRPAAGCRKGNLDRIGRAWGL